MVEHILKVSGHYLYFLWSYKDFRNNVVLMGVVIGGVAVVGVGAFPKSFRSLS